MSQIVSGVLILFCAALFMTGCQADMEASNKPTKAPVVTPATALIGETSSPTPTVVPTNSPTPTVVPTSSPTPTVVPTNSPTPTVAPTSSPTPTVVPTSSSTPTVVPTSSPTATAVPTNSPTPTVVPTMTPKPRPIVGGLASPQEVAWFTTSHSDSLAYLLGQHLHRSLLDPLRGQPQLASEWSIKGSRAVFTLPSDTVWSDGSSLGATDVVDILSKAIERGDLAGIDHVRKLNSQKFVIYLSDTTCPAFMRIATWPIVDVGRWPPKRVSGAYHVLRNGRHSWLIEPELFEYRYFSDELALREAWEQGEINSIVGASRLTMGALPGTQVSSQLTRPVLATLMFRLEEPLLQDQKVREALTLATDRQALFKAAYGMEPNALLTALLPPGHWAAPVAALPSDPKRAARLLSEAGWRKKNEEGVRVNRTGTPLRLTLTLPMSFDQRWEALAKELVVQWATIGVELIPVYVESDFLQERLHTARWQVGLLAYLISSEPDQRVLWSQPAPDDLVGQDLNITGYSNNTVDRLMTQGAEALGCLPQKRATFYKKAWQELLSDRPLWPLFALPLDEVHRPDVQWK